MPELRGVWRKPAFIEDMTDMTATRINRLNFLQILSRVLPGISKLGSVSQSSCFVFSDGWVTTFNEEICCRTQTELPDDLEAAVKAEPLMKWLELVTEDEVDVWREGSEFRLKAGRKKCGIRCESQITLPIDDVALPDSWQPLPEDFFRGIEQVAGTAAGADGVFMTRCIHIHPEYVEACDRRQATRYHVVSGLPTSLLVQAVTISQATKSGLTKIGRTDSWLHFRNKTLIFSCRCHKDAYPTEGVSKMFEFRGQPFALPKGAEVAARLGQVFTRGDKDGERVDVDLQGNRMLVKGQGMHGWTSEELDLSYSGNPVAFRLNPQLLVELVSNYDQCEIGPGRLRIEGDKWVYMTILGRPNEQESESKPPETFNEEEGDDDEDN